jgi:hypothetical protein
MKKRTCVHAWTKQFQRFEHDIRLSIKGLEENNPEHYAALLDAERKMKLLRQSHLLRAYRLNGSK